MYKRCDAAGLWPMTASRYARRCRRTADADAVEVYLAFGHSQHATVIQRFAYGSRAVDRPAPAFGRQAIPMVWDLRRDKYLLPVPPAISQASAVCVRR